MIPFSLIPEKPLFAVSRKFISIGNFLASFFPLMHTWLRQSEYPYSAREFSSMAFTAASFNSLFLFAMLAAISYAVGSDFMFITIIGAGLMFIFTLFSILAYPVIVSMRRGRQIDTNLINAVRQILIELHSGVTLFSAMKSVTIDYGEASLEFKKIVRRIESGMAEADVLADASASTPSSGMKRLLWQISNALKVGSDVSTALEAQLDDLTNERLEQIRRYGQELSPWTMMYMLAAIILPSLGVTTIIVLSTFLRTAVPPVIFPATVVFLLFFQLFFMNLISTRRPAI